jgi:DNA-binding LacI/PurR family transcriptional regulator
MADVGRAAEVSAQTVSRFYTGGYVSPETRERIERAVRELGYQHSRLPQILRARHTDTIGFLAMGPLNYGNTGLLTGINRAARSEGQSLLTAQLDLDPEAPGTRAEIRRALGAFTSMRVDGIVVGTPYLGVETLLEDVGESVPVVSRSERAADRVDTVHADSYGAARLAVQHLVDLGHRRILHVAGPENRNEASERIRGYRDGLAAAGLTELPLLHCAEWDAVSGAAAARDVDLDSFTAVFSANDEIALGFTSVLRERGRVAPDDYSIVGIDDMPESAFFEPPLTTARIDFERLGETALRVVLDRVRGTTAASARLLPSTLTERRSTAPLERTRVRRR